MIISQNYIRVMKIIILISFIDTFVSFRNVYNDRSNDLILFLGLELQSLALYILASLNRDNLKSNESGLKYFVLGALSSGLLYMDARYCMDLPVQQILRQYIQKDSKSLAILLWYLFCIFF